MTLDKIFIENMLKVKKNKKIWRNLFNYFIIKGREFIQNKV